MCDRLQGYKDTDITSLSGCTHYMYLTRKLGQGDSGEQPRAPRSLKSDQPCFLFLF